MSKLVLRVPNFPGKEKLVGKMARAGLQVSKHSPEICLGVGIACGIGATVMACKATLKIDEILEQHHETVEKIQWAIDNADELAKTNNEYSIEDAQRDKFILYLRTFGNFAKIYAPAIILGAASIGFLIGGHRIMMKRNAALMASYAALQKAFDAYRVRVRDEFGEEKENDIFNGVHTRIEEITNSKGKTVKQKREELEDTLNPYRRCFDESSRYWTKNAEHNKFFLAMQQSYANDKLRINGHLFLNEVLDMLGLPRTPSGAVCGWVYGQGDSFVSFGMWDGMTAENRAFINGQERCVWLNFNCDGVIYDLI